MVRRRAAVARGVIDRRGDDLPVARGIGGPQLTLEPRHECLPGGDLYRGDQGIAEHLSQNRYSFTSSHGSVTWRRVARGARWDYEIDEVAGVDLLDAHHTTRFVELEHELVAASRRIEPASLGPNTLPPRMRPVPESTLK